MNSMSDEEFIKRYGRPPVRRRTVKRKKIYWNRIIIALIILIALIMGIVQLISAIAGKLKNNKDNISLSAKTTTIQTENKGTAVSESKGQDSNNADKTAETSVKNDFTVCIDAGHGDYDGGTSNKDGTRVEKNDNLDIALEVQKNLEKQGVNVVMTRDDDTFLDLGERCEVANNKQADLFVSLHRNSYDGDIYGAEVWVNNAEPKADTTLASNILDELSKVGISDNRGVCYGYIGNPSMNYYVNADTKMPSCLVELGFITSPTDNALFDLHLEDYGKAISNAILKTAKDLEIINNDGSRKHNGMFLSEEKYINNPGSNNNSQSSAQETTPASTNSEVVYNTQENEYAQ